MKSSEYSTMCKERAYFFKLNYRHNL